MSQRLQKIDEDIFTISQVFSIEECAALIARAEAIGFEPAAVRTANGPKMMTHIRNNDRVVLEDAELADEMWRRVAAFLPILDSCCPCGVDAQLRFYRYVPGQQFRLHKDGSATNAQGYRSKLSYLLYLNEDCDGGWTNFPAEALRRREEKVDPKNASFRSFPLPDSPFSLFFLPFAGIGP